MRNTAEGLNNIGDTGKGSGEADPPKSFKEHLEEIGRVKEPSNLEDDGGGMPPGQEVAEARKAVLDANELSQALNNKG